jgi:hypothetical protein
MRAQSGRNGGHSGPVDPLGSCVGMIIRGLGLVIEVGGRTAFFLDLVQGHSASYGQ